MAAKVLVTGGTGFIGRCLLRHLAEQGIATRLLHRTGSNVAGIPNEVERVSGSLFDPQTLRNALSDCDVLFHLAATVKSLAPKKEFYSTNVEAVEKILTLATEVGVKRIVYVSSFFALGYAPPGQLATESQTHPDHYHNHYEHSKALAREKVEQLARQGVPVVSIYPCMVYGPGWMSEANYVARMMVELSQGHIPGMIGGGLQRWTFSYVDDVANGILAAWQRGRVGEGYILGGETLNLAEFFKLLESRCGLKAPKRKIPFPVARAYAVVQEALWWLMRRPPLLTREVVNIYEHDWCYSSEKAQRELGYEITPLATGIESTCQWLKREKEI